MKTYYMHTIDGRPAFYVLGKQICFMTFYGLANPLAKSLRQIKAERIKSVKWRKSKGFDNYNIGQYGHFRVSAP